MKKRIMEALSTISDPVKKRALFIAILSKCIVSRGAEMPIVVGGEALEIYTQGNYTTGDIDIKSSYEQMEATLLEMGFRKRGRAFYSEELDIYIDWLGATLDEGAEAERRTVLVEIDEDHFIRLISVEDLIMDRLNAAKWWKDSDSRMWARVLAKVKQETGEPLDVKYLQQRAEAEEVEDELKELLSL
ncbi:MAG: hypothetical protein RBS57_09670 [Desulforhabdus sp.]|jgi:hypothetical protein|nr:hypothetical protein [Desulforhabdus sp.]